LIEIKPFVFEGITLMCGFVSVIGGGLKPGLGSYVKRLC